VRQASIRLVSVCWFKRPDMFKSAVDKLRMHLPFIGGPFKLRVDLDLTLESLKHLGYNHPRLVELLYEELLPDYVDRGMLRKEIPVEDLGCMLSFGSHILHWLFWLLNNTVLFFICLCRSSHHDFDF
jgi:hypothetical protein